MPASRPPSAFVIDAAKVRDYLLSLDHPVGKSKAALFLMCGFVAACPELLAESLFAHASPDHLTHRVETPFGTKWIFEGSLLAPASEVARIRSVWITRTDASFAELVTAYRF